MTHENPAQYHQHERWHIRREITLGHLVITVTLLLGGITTLYTYSNRLALVEQRQDQQDVRVDDLKQGLEKKLDSINRNLEKLRDYIVEGRINGSHK